MHWHVNVPVGVPESICVQHHVMTNPVLHLSVFVSINWSCCAGANLLVLAGGDVSVKRSRTTAPVIPDSPPHASLPDLPCHTSSDAPPSASPPLLGSAVPAQNDASMGPTQPQPAAIAATPTRSGFNKRRREQLSAAAGIPKAGPGIEIEDDAAPPAQRPRTQAATPATPASHREDDDMGGQVRCTDALSRF